MEIRNILESTSYLEFINELDELVYNLLYSPEGGYTLLNSKEAVEAAQGVIEKFNNEAVKILKKVNFKNAQDIVEDKKQELLTLINKHYKKQALIWAEAVYSDMIENCLLSISINKDNKENIDKMYNRALCAISWLKEVRGLSELEQKGLIEKFNDDFAQALYSKDEDYLPNQSPKKSDALLFLEIRSLIINNEERFLGLDLNEYSQCLNEEDLKFFNRLKAEINTYKKVSIKDEINLIDSAIELLNLQNDNEKYEFIKEVDSDFTLFFINNKKLVEEDKISLIKKRINLFKDMLKNQKTYYKKLLTSSLNE